jgi:hypothetical protein
VSGGVIAGAVVGGVALLSIIGVVIFLLCARKRRKEKVVKESAVGEGSRKTESGMGFVAKPELDGLSRTYLIHHGLTIADKISSSSDVLLQSPRLLSTWVP